MSSNSLEKSFITIVYFMPLVCKPVRSDVVTLFRVLQMCGKEGEKAHHGIGVYFDSRFLCGFPATWAEKT